MDIASENPSVSALRRAQGGELVEPTDRATSPSQHILLHKSVRGVKLGNQWLLPLPREGGSRSETEGFSAEPKRFLPT